MKRWLAAAAAVLAGATGVTSAAAPGTARASTALTWNRVYQASSTGSFFSIAAISERNVWAVGELSQGGRALYKPFIKHFDGTAWRPVTFPGTAMYTVSVQATSASDVWVFGYTQNAKNVSSSAAYRWDGKRWHKIPLPAGTGLQGTVVLGPSNVWAFGGSLSVAGDVFHWNGRTWKAYTINLIPQDMAASSGSNVWLTGMTWVNKKTERAKAYRWNGVRWLGVSTPHPVINVGPDVTALSPSSVWLGWETSTKNQAAHWNGHTWTVLTAPANAEADPFEIVPDGRGGYWFGPFADWTGTTWISATDVSPSFSTAGFDAPVRIPGTTTFLVAAGVANTGSSVPHPTIYRLTLG